MPSEGDTGRVEAFSDAVFAIAITLLILEVGIKAEGGSLLYRLAEQWPSYLSFVVSFAVIGIGWLQHHEMFRDIRATDHGLVVLSLVLLLLGGYRYRRDESLPDRGYATFRITIQYHNI